MITPDEAGRRHQHAAELDPHISHLAVVFSLLWSLMIVAIISKNLGVHSLWIEVAAFAIPIPIALYFEQRIVRLRVFSCVAAIVLSLGAAILFGI